MMTQYDIAIIGSGLGGLTSAYILAKNGYKVIVLEKNTQFGGCLQTFMRKGIKFETGMHYIGSVEEGTPLNRFFTYFNLLNKLTLSPLNPNASEIISIQDKTYQLPIGFDNFIEVLSKQFPTERNNIKQYISQLQIIAQSSPMYSFKNTDQINLLPQEFVKTSASAFIDHFSQNRQLCNVLSGIIPLYGGIKGVTPAYIHAIISNFYISGANRIVGGSDIIANLLINSIKEFGGELRNNSRVTNIECDTQKIVSLQVANGERIEAKTVISNTHPQITLNMIDSPLIRRAYRDRVAQMRHSISNFTVYIKFKPNTVPYLNSNYFHYNKDQVWGCEEYSADQWPLNFLYMHICPCNNSKYAQGAEIISYMRFDEIKQWIGNRDENYKSFKKEKAEQLLYNLEQRFPNTLPNIETYYTSTPLTYLDYTGTIEGSMYGVIRDIESPAKTQISQRTRIPNLLFTGQNINSHGILGVIIGSIITCSELLGKTFLINQIKNA